MPTNLSETEVHQKIIQWLLENYWGPIYKAVEATPSLLETLPGFLLAPDEFIIYMGKTHVGVEYVGPERISALPSNKRILRSRYFDFSQKDGSMLNRIIGFQYEQEVRPLTIPTMAMNYVLPTDAGFEKLIELKWNWAAQDMISMLNTGGIEAPVGKFTRIINGRFFDADASGLRTRHIKWLDLAPITYDDSNQNFDSFLLDLSTFAGIAAFDAQSTYPIPDDFKFQRLPKINRFIETIGAADVAEPQITSFLARPEFQFILSMWFSASAIHSELLCEWQSQTKNAIQPDFFVVGPGGYADIVEFKLPELKGSVVVGRSNRETFSAEIASYISQTRVYREYFDDPRNREWVEKRYGFKVYKPKRYLVVGRRSHFDSDIWRSIAADYSDLNILTYDDLIDGVVVQFYR